jgi:hypothetical protein
VEGTYFFLPVHKKRDKTDCSNYRGMLLLSTTYKIVSSVLLSRLTPHVAEIIEGHQCGFQHNPSTTDQIFCIHLIMEKKNASTMGQYTSYL